MSAAPAIELEPPANIEAEQALLGALMTTNDSYGLVSPFLQPTHFLEPLHQAIYTAAVELIAKGRTCNPVLLKSYLPANAMVGDMTVNQYLARLAAESVTVLNAYDYGLAIYEAWLRRQAMDIGHEIIELTANLSWDHDILDQFGAIEEKLTELRLKRTRTAAEPHPADEWYEELAGAENASASGYGVPIAFPEIQEVLSEPQFEAGNLYGLLSSSGEGKTSLVLQLMHHALKEGHPVLFLSYDQNGKQCVRQMAAQQLGISTGRQKRNSLDHRSLSDKEAESAFEFRQWLLRQPFEVIRCTDESATRLITYMRTFIRRKKADKPPLIVIDHIKRIRPDDSKADAGSKAQSVTSPLKAAAETLHAPILLLNQRNSYGLRRDNPRPTDEDLYGGEGARQDYDAIFYLYRFKKWYDKRKAMASSDRDKQRIEEVFLHGPYNGVDDIAEIGCVKARYADETVRRYLTFDAPLTRYSSDQQPKPPELPM